jgi:hypothetical protein
MTTEINGFYFVVGKYNKYNKIVSVTEIYDCHGYILAAASYAFENF